MNDIFSIADLSQDELDLLKIKRMSAYSEITHNILSLFIKGLELGKKELTIDDLVVAYYKVFKVVMTKSRIISCITYLGPIRVDYTTKVTKYSLDPNKIEKVKYELNLPPKLSKKQKVKN